MAQYTAYALYAIYFRDATEYANAVALASGYAFLHSPFTAASTFGITWPLVGGGPLGDKGIYYISPFAPGWNIGHPNPSGVIMDATVDSFLVPGQAGNPASIWPAGPDMLLYWEGIIIRIGGGAGASPAPPANMPQRRWITGFHMDGGGGGDTPATYNQISRDASRTPDGLGFSHRDGTANLSNPINQYDGAFTASKSWERLYVRLRRLPSASSQFWNSHGFPSDSAGGRLEVTSTGQLACFNVDSVGAATFIGTVGTLTLMQWTLLDILLEYNTSGVGGNGRLRVYKNHLLQGDFSIASSSGGLGQNSSRHTRSTVGKETGGSFGLEIDIDDWICSDIPNVAGTESLTSLDWLAGSHVQQLYATGRGPHDSGVWVGDYRRANAWFNGPADTNNARFTSSTALDRLALNTDAIQGQYAYGNKLGAAAALISVWSTRGALSGQLGYSIAGAAPVMSNITQAGAFNWTRAAYRPAGTLNTPTDITTFEVVHDKGNSADAASAQGLVGSVEYIGTWGVEDDATTVDYRTSDIHNGPYLFSAYNGATPPITAPMAVVGGTYTGNGTGQTINLPLYAHWLWIRPLTGAAGVPKWWSSMGGSGHTGDSDKVMGEYPVRVYADSTGQCKFDVAGTNSQINTNLVVYQYIAVCDPTGRWCRNVAFHHPPALASAVNTLVDSAFTPQAAFFALEAFNSTSSVASVGYKGPGGGANGANWLSGGILGSALTFGAGSLTSLASLNRDLTSPCACACFRTTDPDGGVMFQILQYTGNGVNPRTITLTPTSGRFPLWALVMPHNNAAAFTRDASHTGSNSADYSGVNSTTAITGGGIDSLTVNSTLNTNGVVYDVFVICGDTAGWNNGTFYPPNRLSPVSTAIPTTPTPPTAGSPCVVTFPVG